MSAPAYRGARLARGTALPALCILLWWLAFAFKIVDPRLAGSIGNVCNYLVHAIVDGDLWLDIAASVGRNLLGFGIGAALGVAAGLTFGLSRPLREGVLPSIHVLKQVSIFAWVPLISIWFGLGEGARVFVIAIGCWFPVVFNTMEGVAGVSNELIEVARVFKLSRLQVIRRVIVPAALPSIFTGLYVGLVMAWMATLGAEYMLTSTRGVGHLLLDGRENFRMDQLIAGILVVGLIGFLFHALADAVERRVLGWRGRALSGRI